MADSLVLTGVKDVKKHTGTEMLLTRPKRGGDTHSLKEWWKTGANKCYVSCTVFDVTTAAGTVKLVLDSTSGTNVRIDHDGSFNFAFYGINEVRRGALFTTNYELIEHYVFPVISGGKVMTVTPPGSADKPSGTPITIGTATVAGNASPETGVNVAYTVSIDGNASDLSYSWSTTGSGTIQGSSTTAGVQVEFTAGPSTVSCAISSSAATDSPVSGSISVVATAPAPPATSIGTVTISGNSSPGDGDTGEVYSASISGDAGSLTYSWSVTGAGTINGSSTGSSVAIDWSGTDASVISCTVTSTDAGITDSPQTGTLGGISPATVNTSSSGSGY